MTYLSKLRILLPIVAFLFSAAAGITFAAWLDAPNAPPNYGIVGCTPPCEQEDFMPMNLSDTTQTKLGGAIFGGNVGIGTPTPSKKLDVVGDVGATGDVVASGFFDLQNTAYFIDPAATSGYSGAFLSPVGIKQRYPGASLAVNNGIEATGKTGSLNDAIYAYANNATGAALSAEQGGPAGYAVYASGGINYFQGNVGIGTTTPTAKLDVVGSIGATGDVCTALGGGKCLSGGFTLPTGAHEGCILVSTDDLGTLMWKDRISGGVCPSFAERCAVAGGQSVDGSGNCVYTYSDPVTTFGWSREIKTGDIQYICANMGGHPTWTYLSRTTSTHGTACGGTYGLVYWNGTSFINWGEFGGICGGNVTVDVTVTCKVPISM